MASNYTTIQFNYAIHKPIIYTVVGIFTVLGLWGNLNVVIIHIRKKKLLNKYGTLLCSLSFCQTFCLFFEWIGIVYSLTAEKLVRSVCFSLLGPYIFTHCMQTGLLTTISLDLLISITFPIRHRVSPVNTYILFISTPTITYGLATVILGAIYANDDVIAMCNPPSSLASNVNQFWYMAAMIAGGITIFNYILTYSLIFYKNVVQRLSSGRIGRDPLELEKKALRSITVILFVFVFTRYVGTVVSTMLRFFNVQESVITLYQNYNVFFAFICYSQNYYVCITTSSEYRRLLKEQFYITFPFLPQNVQHLSSSHHSKTHFTHTNKSLAQPG